MKKNILIFILILIANSSISQKNNSILINSDAIKFTKSNYLFNIFSQIGITYQRKINKSIAFNIAYSQWNRSKNFGMPTPRPAYIVESCWKKNNGKDCTGKVYARENYKMIDFSGDYFIKNFNKIGNLSISLGISFQWGLNHYLDSIVTPSIPPYDQYDIYVHQNKMSYIGATAGLKYNYPFWKDRMIVGLHSKCRKYFTYNSIQFDFGLHFGYSF